MKLHVRVATWQYYVIHSLRNVVVVVVVSRVLYRVLFCHVFFTCYSPIMYSCILPPSQSTFLPSNLRSDPCSLASQLRTL